MSSLFTLLQMIRIFADQEQKSVYFSNPLIDILFCGTDPTVEQDTQTLVKQYHTAVYHLYQYHREAIPTQVLIQLDHEQLYREVDAGRWFSLGRKSLGECWQAACSERGLSF